MIFTENSIELSKLISKGNVLYAKYPGMKEPSLSIVQYIREKDIYLSVSGSFIENNLSKGDNISCQLLDGDYEYVIEGTTEEIKVGRPVTLCIRVDKVKKYRNNRIFKRYSVDFKALIKMAGSDNDISAVVKNVSIIGVGVVSKQFIHKDSIVTLRVATFISNDEEVEFKARVVRAVNNGNHFEYGLEIIEISEKNKDMVDKLIFCLNSNENIFVEELI